MNKIRTKLLTAFFGSIVFLAVISLYVNFFIGRLSNAIYETSLLKRATEDIVFHSVSIANTLSFYLSTTDIEKHPAIKAEYEYSMNHFHHSIETLKESKKFDKYILAIDKHHQDFMTETERLIETFNKRFEKENTLTNIVKDLKENRHQIINNTKAGSEKLKLDIAQMGYKDKEFNWQYQDKKHAAEWLETINVVKAGLKREGFNSLLLFADNYLNSAQKAVETVNNINNLKLEEQYQLDRVKNIFVEINTNSAHIAKDIDLGLRQLLGQSENQRLISFIIIFFSFVFGGSVVYVISRKIAGSIEGLTLTAKKVAGGNLSQRSDIKSNDEIGYLTSVFNQMLDNIDISQIKLKEAEKQLKNINLELENRVLERTTELEGLKSNLEKIVEERTRNLEEKVKELERFHDLTVGREMKMIELKKEIGRLKTK